MGTKAQKMQRNKVRWTMGSKERKSGYSAMGMSATAVENKIRGVSNGHNCEMCGSFDGVWREKVVCICDKCWVELKSQLHL